jgi:retron-type reverse transcriptase
MSMVKAMGPETADANDPGKGVGKAGWKDWDVRWVSLMMRISSLSENPVRHYARRLADWINPAGSRKVHSLVDKVYKMKNLELAWQRVRQNRGAGGVDGESIQAFEEKFSVNLNKLHEGLKAGIYQPQPVRQKMIPKPGQPGKGRPLGHSHYF